MYMYTSIRERTRAGPDHAGDAALRQELFKNAEEAAEGDGDAEEEAHQRQVRDTCHAHLLLVTLCSSSACRCSMQKTHCTVTDRIVTSHDKERSNAEKQAKKNRYGVSLQNKLFSFSKS